MTRRFFASLLAAPIFRRRIPPAYCVRETPDGVATIEEIPNLKIGDVIYVTILKSKTNPDWSGMPYYQTNPGYEWIGLSREGGL